MVWFACWRPSTHAKRLTNLFHEFFSSEQTSGILLIICTIASILLVNSSLGTAHLNFWHSYFGFTAGPVTLHYRSMTA